MKKRIFEFSEKEVSTLRRALMNSIRCDYEIIDEYSEYKKYVRDQEKLLEMFNNPNPPIKR